MKIDLLSTWAFASSIGVCMATLATRASLEVIQYVASEALDALDAFEAEFSAQIRGQY